MAQGVILHIYFFV